MYSGPGAGPMLAAASAWDGLAEDLYSTATACSSAISGLSGQWLGPASTTMATATAPYLEWMGTTAAHAEQVANQARAAAAAYEAAFAMTVPPPVIAANRSLLMSLVATNFLGQNTPAIAATEAHYGEMWAQDAAAMYGYAGESAAASQLAPVHTPPQAGNPVATPMAAAAQSTGALAGTDTQVGLSQFTAAMPQALQGLSSAGAASGASDSSMASLGSLAMPLRMAAMPMMMLMRMLMMGATGSAAGAKGATAGAVGSAAAAGSEAGLLGSGGLGNVLVSGTASPVSAGLGQAAPVGALSVPQSWTAAIPGATSAGTAIPAATAGTGSAAAAPAGLAGVPPMMPLANTAGRAAGEAAPRLGASPGVMARSPLGG